MPDKNISLTSSGDEAAGRAEQTRSGVFYRPNVDIVETADELLVLADIPGTPAGDVDIRFEDGVLTLHARVPARRDESAEYLLHEYGVGDFYGTFQVSEAIDASRITASYAEGVLTLHLPKAAAVKPRKITVKTG